MTERPGSQIEDALARAERLRAKFQRALQRARMELAAAEEDNRTLHDEIARMDRSVGRRLFVTLRGAVNAAAIAVRHPLWTAGSAARRLGAVPPVAAAGAAATHLVRRAHLLRLLTPVRQWTDQSSTAEAIHWIGPLTLRHRTLQALFCHPNSGTEYRLSAMPGSRFVTHVGVSPLVWRERPPVIVFHVEIRSPSGGWTRSAERRIDAAARITDRRWHTLRIDLPPVIDRYAEEVVVTLSTSLAAGYGPEHAWAVFGEPRLERTRPAAEVKRSMVAFASRLRQGGVRGAWRLATEAAGTGEAERYGRWCAGNTPGPAELDAMTRAAEAFAVSPQFTVVVPVYNTDPRWLRACIESVRAQVYPHWQLSIADDASTSADTVAVLREYEADPRIVVTYLARNAHISEASNAALSKATGDFVALLDHDDELTPDALFHVAKFLNAQPDADVIYSDEDKLDLAGARCDPYFKPDWSPEHFLTCMYTCHLMVVRRRLLDDVGGFRRGYEGAQDYDLVLRLMERTSRIHHIPRILYHWRKLPESTSSAGMAKPWAMDAGRLALEDYVRRTGLDAEVLPGPAAGVFRLRRAIRGTPLVSIVIPTSGRLRRAGGRDVDLLAACIRSVVDRTSWSQYEFILVAEPAGLPPSTLAALEGTRHVVVADDAGGGFNFSRKVNLGVSRAGGDHVVLLNDDVEVVTAEWLTAMLEWSQDREVGAVGAKLLYPDGRLQHIGLVLGVRGVAAHAFHQHPGTSPGYASSALSIRNYSAVTAACMMTRRAVFDEAGGFDEALPVDYNDVDYCLRLRRAGYRVVFTPYAQLYHHESASVGARLPAREAADLMHQRWGSVIANDPYYNPNLSRDWTDYRL